MVDAGPSVEERQPPRMDEAPALQVLATEHWSLLATRSLTYSESLSRVSMFLSVLSGAVIALALVAQADRFGETFVMIAILLLSVVVFVGAATVVRLERLNQDDLRWVMGMNRLRRAYLERLPELEHYFVTSKHDDFLGMAVTQGFVDPVPRGPGQLAHAVQTLPGMVSVIVGVVAGALAAMVAHAVGGSTPIDVVAGVGGFVLTLVLFGAWGVRTFLRFRARLVPRFPGGDSAKTQ